MGFITVQLGQCGNQLGCSFFNTLAKEFSEQPYDDNAKDDFFRELSQASSTLKSKKYAARSVLVDMEPKVVHAALHEASASNSWWRYAPNSWFCQQSGSGNNWAHGYHGYGPHVCEDAINLIRKEAEHCDMMSGFLLLQSLAGGTGSGLGTYIATALRDEFQSSFILNCGIWPYESGEVIVQSYNTLLSLSHLGKVSDGMLLLENENLHGVCNRLMNIQRPSFSDMNGVAARALASALLPSYSRSAAGAAAAPAAGTHGIRLPSTTSRADRSPARAVHEKQAPLESSLPPISVLPHLVEQLCSHPSYRFFSLKAVPQVPPSSIDFTTFTWASILKRLRQMHLTGSFLEEGMDWGVSASSEPGSRPLHAANKCLSTWLILRGQAAGQVDVSDFRDPALYSLGAVSPLSVTYHPNKFNKCSMAAALLSNDRECVQPVSRMMERAYTMFASRAYVHQYEKYGMTAGDFEDCFAYVEEVVERYNTL